MMKRPTINVLWTGGLDSTYLMFRLSQYDIDIQPYYIIDHTRESLQKELKAMDSIAKALGNAAGTKAVILPIVFVDYRDFRPDQEIDHAWKVLNKECELGTQYRFLATFARQYSLSFAVGVLFGDRSKVELALRNRAVLKETEDYDGMFLQVESEEKNDPAYLVFEHLLFPKFMRNLEKTEEWEYMRQHGGEAIARMTWFCHRPVFGMTCGHCNPCKDALNEGMAFRVSRLGRLLGAVRGCTYDPLHKAYAVCRQKLKG